jgi:hypothetical protein
MPGAVSNLRDSPRQISFYDSRQAVHRHVGNAKTDTCAGCHATHTPEDVRGASSTADYDGDGDISEGMVREAATTQEKLLSAMQATEEKPSQISLGSITDD